MQYLISKTYFTKTTEAAPLAVFRILFGLMMFISIVRFWAHGWIDKLYVQPRFFFSYYGFEWIPQLGSYTYILFIICGITALCISLGYQYRIAITLFFLSFTYIELLDKTTYLNHYYFISILSFLLIFLPAHHYFSLDAKRGTTIRATRIPNWSIDSIKVLLGIVYFYAGLAKLNSDWLLGAMPLKIWLPSKYDTPLIGTLLGQEWVHYAFSYTGALYDLLIPFFLYYKRTRGVAFIIVVIFHILTRVLFPIGMFPYIMIISTLIFFDAGIHHKILKILSKLLGIDKSQFDKPSRTFAKQEGVHVFLKRSKFVLLASFFAFQLLFPFRYLLYPGELFWTEEGYRFSWRVMLIEKAGYATFKIVNPKDKTRFYINNDDFLTSFQQKQMATQPDFILQYAHYLRDHYIKEGMVAPQVYVESYVTLNGRLSAQFIDPKINLSTIKESFEHKTWIIPFTDEIKGL